MKVFAVKLKTPLSRLSQINDKSEMFDRMIGNHNRCLLSYQEKNRGYFLASEYLTYNSTVSNCWGMYPSAFYLVWKLNTSFYLIRCSKLVLSILREPRFKLKVSLDDEQLLYIPSESCRASEATETVKTSENMVRSKWWIDKSFCRDT